MKYDFAFEQCCALVSGNFIKSEKTYGGLVRRPEITLRRNPACFPTEPVKSHTVLFKERG